jgi:hypothetical protein
MAGQHGLKLYISAQDAAASKYAKTSSRTLATKELAAAPRQRTVSYFRFHQGIVDQKQNNCPPSQTLLFSVFPL